MRTKHFFRRFGASALAAATLISGTGIPVAGAADGVDIVSFDGSAVTVNTNAALNILDGLDSTEAPESARSALSGYTLAEAGMPQNGVTFYTAYKRTPDGGVTDAPAYQFLLIAENDGEEPVAIQTVNGQTPTDIAVYEQGEASAQAVSNELKPPAEEQDGKEEADSPSEPESSDDAANPGEPTDQNEPSIDALPVPPADPNADIDSDMMVEPEAPQQSETVTDTTPEPVEPTPEQKPDPVPEPAPEPEPESAPAPEGEPSPAVAFFSAGTRVLGPRAVMANGTDGENETPASGWVILPEGVSGYSFTVYGKQAAQTVRLYGKDADPEKNPGNSLSGKIDPEQVFGIRYDCVFDASVTLHDIAEKSMTVDLSDFGKLFNLGGLGGANDQGAATLTLQDGTELGTIRVDTDSKLATVRFAESFSENKRALSFYFWMNCSLKNDAGQGDKPESIHLGDTTIEFDWSHVTEKQPACTLSKKVKKYDAATRTITWEIVLTPENGATLAGVTLTDKLSTEEAAFTGLQVNGVVVAFDDNASVQIDGGKLIYTFADSEIDWPANKAATVLVNTQLKSGFFADDASEWKITNKASVKSSETHAFIEPQPATAEKTFKTQFLSKSGKYNGAASNKITWTIKINDLPFAVQNLKIYDLLPADVQIDKNAVINKRFNTVITEINASNQAKWAGNTELPQALRNEIGAMGKHPRQLITLSQQGDTLSASSYTFTFQTKVLPGVGSGYATSNTAYLTYDIPGAGEGDSGHHASEPGVSSGNVGYVQTAIDKNGSYDRSNRRFTWTIDANNNKQNLTGGVKIEDNLKETLKSANPNEKSEFRAETLQWWKDGGVKAPVTQLGAAPTDTTAYPAEPAYFYDAANELLTIYVKEMNAETYHFSFETEGVGQKFFGQQGVWFDQNNVTVKNYATLFANGTSVKDQQPVTAENKAINKMMGAPEGESAEYNPQDNTLWWMIHLNMDGRLLDEATVTDTLPKELSYAEDYALYIGTPNNTSDTLKRGAKVQADLSPSIGESNVTFHFNNLMQNGGRYILYVKTRVDPLQLKGNLALKNHAALNGKEDGHKLFAQDYHDYTVNKQSIIKSGKQKTDADGGALYEVDWTIDVNKDGKANGYEKPTVTDTLTDGLTLQQKDGDYAVSIKRLQWNGKAFTAEETELSQTLRAQWSYAEDTRAFRFELPQNESGHYDAYRLVLTTDVDPDFAGQSITNTVSYSAQTGEIGGGSGSVNIHQFGAGGSVSGGGTAAERKSLTLTKVSSQNNSLKLSGAKFDVSYSADGEDYKLYAAGVKTKADGTLKISGLPKDTRFVRFVETQAPNGYRLPENATFVFAFDNEKNGAITVENDPTGALTVEKQDAATGAVLAGAKFTLKDAAGHYYDASGAVLADQTELETDAAGQITFGKLPVGAYTLTETAAPAGYQAGMAADGQTERKTSWKLTVEQNADGDMTVSCEALQLTDGKLVITNVRSGDLTVIKRDAKTAAALAGAKFTLKDAAGIYYGAAGKLGENDARELETQADGKLAFGNLPMGEYTLTETVAPAGYHLGEQLDGQTARKTTWKLTLKRGENGATIVTSTDGKVENGAITITNVRYGTLSVVKRDAYAENGQLGKTLAGAAFTLKDASGASYDTTGAKSTEEKMLSTDDDGKIVFQNLPVGSYTLTETKAPDGYHLGEQLAGQPARKTVWPLTVKQGADGAAIVERADSEGAATVENGVVTIWNTRLGTLSVVKHDAEPTYDAAGNKAPGKLLAGAAYALTDEAGRYLNQTGAVIDGEGDEHSFQTDDNGLAQWSGLQTGKYTVTETAAPDGYYLGETIAGQSERKTAWQIELYEENGAVSVRRLDTEGAAYTKGATLGVMNEREPRHHNGGGGGNNNNNKPNPPGGTTDIPDGEVPLSPGDIIDIPEGEIPLVPGDTVDLPDENVPLAPGEGEKDGKTAEIQDEEVPKAAAKLPQTGGLTPGLLFPLGLLTAGIGALLGRRKDDEE